MKELKIDESYAEYEIESYFSDKEIKRFYPSINFRHQIGVTILMGIKENIAHTFMLTGYGDSGSRLYRYVQKSPKFEL